MRGELILNRFRFSTLLYIASVVFSVSVLIKVFIDRYRLPEGVCPTAANNQWMYAAIVLLIVSTVVSTVADRNNKNQKMKK